MDTRNTIDAKHVKILGLGDNKKSIRKMSAPGHSFRKHPDLCLLEPAHGLPP